jgi:hypothetical protein
LLLATFSLGAQNLNHCANGLLVRKEFSSLNETELEIFFTTIQAAMETPHPTNQTMSIWESFAQRHKSLGSLVHGNSNFFFFHRLFLIDLEIELKKLNSTFQLPYFNSGLVFENWQNSSTIVLTGERFQIQRNFKTGVTFSPVFWNEALFKSTNEAERKGFFEWTKQAENFHGSIHYLTGGIELDNDR